MSNLTADARVIVLAANAAGERLEELCSAFAQIQNALEATAHSCAPDAPEEKFAVTTDLEAQRNELLVKLIEAWHVNEHAQGLYASQVEPLLSK